MLHPWAHSCRDILLAKEKVVGLPWRGVSNVCLVCSGQKLDSRSNWKRRNRRYFVHMYKCRRAPLFISLTTTLNFQGSCLAIGKGEVESVDGRRARDRDPHWENGQAERLRGRLEVNLRRPVGEGLWAEQAEGCGNSLVCVVWEGACLTSAEHK